MFDNGLNCGRWVRVTISDYCNAANGGAGNQYFCRGGSGWVKAEPNKDMGQSFVLKPVSSGGSEYRIRVYDANDQLINAGRVYRFSFPESCGYNRSGPFTEVACTVE